MHCVLNLIYLFVCCCIYVRVCTYLFTICLHSSIDPLDLGFNETVTDNCDYLDYSEIQTDKRLDKNEFTVMQLNIRVVLNKQGALK